MDTNGNPTAIDNHQVVFICDSLEGNKLTGLVCYIQSLYALRASIGDTVVLYKRTLTIAMFAYD